MKNFTQDRILKYIKRRKQVSAHELAEAFEITRQALYKHLPKLLENGQIKKTGKPPKVWYRAAAKPVGADIPVRPRLSLDKENIIKKNYLLITPAGERLEGWEGFSHWCERQGLPLLETALAYVQTFQKFEKLKTREGLLDGSIKLKNTFPEVFLDKVFYLDFYSIERFGKTRLGQLLLYAKQSQNKNLIRELTEAIRPRISGLIKKFRIQAVGFIPPTVKREVQLMTELKKRLDIHLPILNIAKIKTTIAVPQKSLNRLEDRVENADQTIAVDERRAFKNILLIDDALGSGATMNETAKKIRRQKLCSGQIIGLAITGSFKGFDVISEV